jgi:predicted ATP-grasp superfamily ATP-dependent carboligase
MTFPVVMVLDGETRATLGVVRSLGRKGVPIIVGSNSRLGQSGFSRYAHRRFSYPCPSQGMEAAHSVILEQVRAMRPRVLMPVFEEGWAVVYEFYDEYESLAAIVPNPGRELFGEVTDKDRLTELARIWGVPVPRSFRPQTVDEALALAHSLPYPVLLKPQQSTAGRGILRVDDDQQFRRIIPQMQDVPLIQERIEGEDLELTILCVHGEPIAGSAYVSLRNAPLPYGPPIACRTIKDETLMRIGMDFLRNIRYHGVAHLDFRADNRDGQPKLLDFNARLAGTNEISLRSGVDFGHMLYMLALGERPGSSFEYQLGLEFRWYLLGEFRHLAATSEKVRTLQSLLKWRHVAADVSFSDPLPHLAFLALVGGALGKAVLRRAGILRAS